MIAASQAIQRPVDARLLTIAGNGRIDLHWRSALPDLLCRGDLVVANDAATLPASLAGLHEPSGRFIELRLADRASLAPEDAHDFSVILFGEGDHRTRTEDRAAPPVVKPGDGLRLGPLYATVSEVLGHPRFVAIHFEGSPGEIWHGIAAHGRPVQYAHVPGRLALWDVWTPIAGPAVAFEAPSAGFALDWAMVKQLRKQGVGFVTLTHAAGLSSTGDDTLDARFPLDEAYDIPPATAAAIVRTRANGGRIVAIGTTVVRALEHAADGHGSVRAGPKLATQRLGAQSALQIVDVILSGTHEPGSSHYELLRAFADDATMKRADRVLDALAFRTHEFGDSVLVESPSRAALREAA